MNHARYCDEIVAQSELLANQLAGADLTIDVPSCPGWNQSSRHAQEAPIGTSARAFARSSCRPMMAASAVRPSRCRHSW